MHNIYPFKEQLEYIQNCIAYWQAFADYRAMLRFIKITHKPKLDTLLFFSDNNLLLKKNMFEEKLEDFFKKMMFKNEVSVFGDENEMLRSAIHNYYLDRIEHELEKRGLLYLSAQNFLESILDN